MEQRSVALAPPHLAEEQLGFFRWAGIAGKMLITNDAGDWALLTEAEFNDLLAGRVVEGHPRFKDLQQKSFLRDGLDLDGLAARIARRNRQVRTGPHVHVVTLTLRGSQTANTGANAAADMSDETAEQVIDLAFQSTSPSITFELCGQGGEPLLNFAGVRHFVEFARTRGEQAGKTPSFILVSNFTGMTEEAAEWVIANDVSVCTSLDGPATLHDWNRQWKGGSTHAEVVRWIDYFHRRDTERGRDSETRRVEALSTTTRKTLTAWREVVDEYVARGLRTISLQPLTPFGLARDAWSTIGYSAAEYLDFYRHALDYILELNRRGVDIIERTASIFLTKILTSDDSGLDIQSPSGAGTAQIAYNVDGTVFPSDEARLVGVMGDPLFELGHVRDLTVSEVIRHPTVRAIAAASLLDAQPMCADCWNKPYCGVFPVYNFVTQGDLFAQRPRSLKCKEHMAVSGRLFELLNGDDSETAEILRRWPAANPHRPSDGRALKEAP